MRTLPFTKIRNIILVIGAVGLIGGIGYRIGEKHATTIILQLSTAPGIAAPSSVHVDFSLFWDVWQRLHTFYIDRATIDTQKLVWGAISGMVNALDDPYTVFLPPTEQKQSKEDLAGSFEGVGMQLGYKDGKLAVIAPLADTPAQKAGVKAGDLILKIKDEAKKLDKETTGVSLPEAVTMIRGPEGTTVTLTLAREGEKEPFEVILSREKIVVKSVEVVFKDKAAHLKLLRFGERTNDEWEKAIDQIEEKMAKGEVKGVVLDLRNNPGGFLQGAVYIASEFLADGVVVKQEQSGNGGTQTFSVNRQGRLLSTPLVVLINQGSASASEIVAGVLQEEGRAKLVGEKTFGKGTIQEAEELTGGSGLHITIARWLLPSGKWIDKEGIKPDNEVKMDEKDQTKDPQLEKALELLR